MRVSWRHEHTEFQSPLTFEQKVDLFYEQTLGWQLHIADLIANGGMTFEAPVSGARPTYSVPAIEHSGFAVLLICLSYFELVGSIVQKRTGSGVRFRAGVRDVFPRLFKSPTNGEKLARRLYSGGRCGLYHAGRTKHQIGLGTPLPEAPIAYIPQSDSVAVSPELLPRELVEHLKRLKDRLLDPAELALRSQFRARFDKGFD